jgi:hypothetical protein
MQRSYPTIASGTQSGGKTLLVHLNAAIEESFG